MLLQTINFNRIYAAIQQAKVLQQQILETESAVLALTNWIKTNNLKLTNPRKLVQEVNLKVSSGVALESISFLYTPVVAIATIANSDARNAQFRTLLSPLIGKDVTSSAVEKTKKSELLFLSRSVQKYGIKKANFDTILKRIFSNTDEQLDYVIITPDGFIVNVPDAGESPIILEGGANTSGNSPGREYFLTPSNQVALTDSDIFIFALRYDTPTSVENGVRVFDLLELFASFGTYSPPDTVDIASWMGASVTAIEFSNGTIFPVSISKFSQQLNQSFVLESQQEFASIINQYKIPEEAASRYKFVIGDKQFKYFKDFLLGYFSDNMEQDQFSSIEQIPDSFNFLHVEKIDLGTSITTSISSNTFWESQTYSFPIYVLDTQTNTSYFWKDISFKLRYTPQVPQVLPQYYFDSNNQVSLTIQDIFINGRRFDSPAFVENRIPVFYHPMSFEASTTSLEEAKRWNFLSTQDFSITKINEEYIDLIYPTLTGQVVDPAEIEQSVMQLFTQTSVPSEVASRYKFKAVATVTPEDQEAWGDQTWVLKANERNYSLSEEERATGHLTFVSTVGPGSEVQYNVCSQGNFQTSDGRIIPARYSVQIQVVDTQTNTTYNWQTIEYIVRNLPNPPTEV